VTRDPREGSASVDPTASVLIICSRRSARADASPRSADSLDVCEGNATRVFEVSLATVNQTLDHLALELRTMRDGLVRPSSGLNEAAHAARKSRTLVALSARKP
jgi:hypothetical protein